MGFLDQGWAAGGDSETARMFAQYSVAIHVAMYLAMIPLECALFIYCMAGVRKQGGNLQTLTGGRWTSWKGIAVDVGVAIPFWMVLLSLNALSSRLLGSDSVDSVNSLLPQKLPEILTWIAVSVSAGVCEEVAYRGYLQQQLLAFGGNLSVAILGQGLVFGLVHCYQGWKSTIVVCIIGVLLGALAAWRRNLRANIIVHTWVDIWEGWLKFAV